MIYARVEPLLCLKAFEAQVSFELDRLFKAFIGAKATRETLFRWMERVGERISGLGTTIQISVPDRFPENLVAGFYILKLERDLVAEAMFFTAEQGREPPPPPGTVELVLPGDVVIPIDNPYEARGAALEIR